MCEFNVVDICLLAKNYDFNDFSVSKSCSQSKHIYSRSELNIGYFGLISLHDDEKHMCSGLFN